MWPTALGYLAAFLVAAAHPGERHIAMSLANAVFAINGLVIWRPATLRPRPRGAPAGR